MELLTSFPVCRLPYQKQLRDVLSSEIVKDPAGTTTGAHIDVMPWLSRMTLDVIGLAGELMLHVFARSG